MKLYDAIYIRKSIRKFELRAIEQDRMNRLERFIQSIHPLFPDIEYKIKILPFLEKHTYIKGIFCVKAPYYLVFYSQDTELAAQNAGYILEQIVLYLTMKGLGSCYQGGVKTDELTEYQKEGMKALMVVAFGYGKDNVWQDSEDRNRIKTENLVLYQESVGDEMLAILEAGRLAPSAMNGQPWRFVAYSDKIQIFQRRKMPPFLMMRWLYSIDIGIVICHLMLGAEELWVDAKFEKTENFSEKQLKNHNYIGTIRL